MWWLRLDESDRWRLLPLDGAGPAVAVEAAVPVGSPDGLRTTLELARGATEPVLLVPVPGVTGTWLAIADRAPTAGEVEDVVNHVAHDIRNLILAVGLQAEIGILHPGEPGETPRLQAILGQVDTTKTYLERLLRFARAVRLEPHALDIASFLEHEASSQSTVPGRTVHLALADGLGSATWDAGLLAAALAELLDNAWRSAEPPPPVELRAGATPAGVTIEVVDRGNGIPPEAQQRLGVPMNVRRAGAAGLGLAIARKLIRAHGGRLALVSSPGGTTARIELPREARGA